MERLVAAIFALMAGVALGQKISFERYQSVVDRYPFGAPPANFNPNQMASEVSRTGAASGEELTPEQEAIVKAVSFSVINLEANGELMVGFTDLSVPNSPKHYYMRVGETRNGWLVKEADQLEKTMTVEKDGIEVSLALGSNSKDSVPLMAKSTSSSGSTGAAVKSSLLTTSGKADDPASTASRGTFRERRMRREAERAAQAEEIRAMKEARAKEQEERAAREEEMRREREAEREEQREQLRAIQEELRRAREDKERRENEAHDQQASEGEDQEQ